MIYPDNDMFKPIIGARLIQQAAQEEAERFQSISAGEIPNKEKSEEVASPDEIAQESTEAQTDGGQ